MTLNTKKLNSPIQVLDRLHDSGDLEAMVKSGLISVSVILWRKIFHAYESRILEGETESQSVTDISDTFGVSERTVYRTLNRLK